MISELTGMESANASMYDGATATAEVMFMMVASSRKKNRVLVSSTISERVLEVVRTYARFHGVELTEIPECDGVTDLKAIPAELAKGDVAGVIVPTPNRYGIIEDYTGLADMVHEAKALLGINADPSALAVLRTPAEWGADIACGDGQTLGMPLQFGGPYLGYIACSNLDAPQNARTRGGCYCRCIRKALLCAYPPGSRTAYPPPESHFKHLLKTRA